MRLITFNMDMKIKSKILDLNVGSISAFIRNACCVWLKYLMEEMEKPEFFDIHNLTHPEKEKHMNYYKKQRLQTEPTLLTTHEGITGFMNQWVYGLLEKYPEGLSFNEIMEKTGCARCTIIKATEMLYKKNLVKKTKEKRKYIWKKTIE